jgi:hypothetical protein
MDSTNAGRIGTMPLYPTNFIDPGPPTKLKADTVTDGPVTQQQQRLPDAPEPFSGRT